MLGALFRLRHNLALGGLLALAAAVGCTPVHRPVPFDPPTYRPLEPTDDPCSSLSINPDGTGLQEDSCPVRQPRNLLALSSGGVYGAYSAGVLSGWSATGTRPEFDVVTGVSTGALIAPFAFLGPEYDCLANRLYVGVKADDIYRYHTWISIPFKDAVASSKPLRKLIASQITPDLMTKLAAEHRRGRRLYVGTTNLDTRRFVVWDLGAIACRGTPDACCLLQDVILASASIPGMLPPVAIHVEVDGKQYRELHCDGGVTATVFMPSRVFAQAAKGNAGKPVSPGGSLYVIVAGKLYPDSGPVRQRVLPVLGATADAILYANTRSELANLYALSHGAGLAYRQTSLRQDFITVNDSLQFDNKEQTRLLAEGMRIGSEGPIWQSGPPSLMAGDGDFIRTGVKLRRQDVPVVSP